MEYNLTITHTRNLNEIRKQRYIVKQGEEGKVDLWVVESDGAMFRHMVFVLDFVAVAQAFLAWKTVPTTLIDRQIVRTRVVVRRWSLTIEGVHVVHGQGGVCSLHVAQCSLSLVLAGM
jgi:hypothetical protein